MKSVFTVLVASIVAAISQQQQQLHWASRPTRALVWLTPYSPYNKPVLANYQPIYDNHQEEIDEIPSKIVTPHSFRRKNRPSIPLAYVPLVSNFNIRIPRMKWSRIKICGYLFRTRILHLPEATTVKIATRRTRRSTRTTTPTSSRGSNGSKASRTKASTKTTAVDFSTAAPSTTLSTKRPRSPSRRP